MHVASFCARHFSLKIVSNLKKRVDCPFDNCAERPLEVAPGGQFFYSKICRKGLERLLSPFNLSGVVDDGRGVKVSGKARIGQRANQYTPMGFNQASAGSAFGTCTVRKLRIGGKSEKCEMKKRMMCGVDVCTSQVLKFMRLTRMSPAFVWPPLPFTLHELGVFSYLCVFPCVFSVAVQDQKGCKGRRVSNVKTSASFALLCAKAQNPSKSEAQIGPSAPIVIQRPVCSMCWTYVCSQ